MSGSAVVLCWVAQCSHAHSQAASATAMLQARNKCKALSDKTGKRSSRRIVGEHWTLQHSLSVKASVSGLCQARQLSAHAKEPQRVISVVPAGYALCEPFDNKVAEASTRINLMREERMTLFAACAVTRKAKRSCKQDMSETVAQQCKSLEVMGCQPVLQPHCVADQQTYQTDNRLWQQVRLRHHLPY